MKAGRIVMLVLGCVIALIGLVMFIGGGVGIIVYATQRDDDGFFRTDDIELMSPTTAITSENLDLGGNAGDADWIMERGDFATVTLDVRPVGEAGPVFVGIGPTADVTAYLEGVSYDELTDIDIGDSGDDVRYERIDGDRAPTPPGEETFWAAQSTGDEPLTWDVDSGDWTAVVMNADGSSGIDVVARAGIKLDWLLPLAIVVCVLGYLLLAGGVVLAVFGARGPRSTGPPPTIQATPGPATTPPPTTPPPTAPPPTAPPSSAPPSSAPPSSAPPSSAPPPADPAPTAPPPATEVPPAQPPPPPPSS